MRDFKCTSEWEKGGDTSKRFNKEQISPPISFYSFWAEKNTGAELPSKQVKTEIANSGENYPDFPFMPK